jgi:hypothetical protein
VPSRDDDQFERYLKQFQPLPPETLPMEADRRNPRRLLAFVMWAAAAAVVVVAVTLGIHHRPTATHTSSESSVNSANVERSTTAPVLTIGEANAWLARSPSFKAAVDEMAMHSSNSQISASKRSALALLSQETTKL